MTEKKLDKDIKNAYGHSLLHKAVIHDNTGKIQSLIDDGFDKERIDSTGLTATELAIILKKEWLIPYIDGFKGTINEEISDAILNKRDDQIIPEFKNTLLERHNVTEKMVKLHQNRKKLRPHYKNPHAVIASQENIFKSSRCVQGLVNQWYNTDGSAKFVDDSFKNEETVCNNSESVLESFKGVFYQPSDLLQLVGFTQVELDTILSQNTHRLSSNRKIDLSSNHNGNSLDLFFDSGLSTLSSFDGEAFDVDDDMLSSSDQEEKDMYIILSKPRNYSTTKQWIENKGFCYNLNNNNEVVNFEIIDSNLTEKCDNLRNSKRSFQNLLSTTKPRFAAISKQCNVGNLHKRYTFHTYKSCKQKRCASTGKTQILNSERRQSELDSLCKRQKLNRSKSWPFSNNYQPLKKSYQVMEDNFEVWEFENDNKSTCNSENKKQSDVTTEIIKISSSDDKNEVFYTSLENGGELNAGYNFHNNSEGRKQINVLSSSYQTLNESNINLTSPQQKMRSISESETRKHVSNSDSKVPNRGLFGLLSLRKAKSSSELPKTVKEAPIKSVADSKSFTNDFGMSSSPGKKKHSIFSYFSPNKKSSSLNDIPNSPTSNVSSQETRDSSTSILASPASGEKVHILLVTNLKSPSKAENSSQKHEFSNDFLNNFRDKSATLKNPAQDKICLSPDKQTKQNVRYNIIFTPEESKVENAKKQHNSSSNMTALQQGLLPLVVGVGLGEEESMKDVINDVASPHTVIEHGCFTLSGGDRDQISNNNINANDSTTNKSLNKSNLQHNKREKMEKTKYGENQKERLDIYPQTSTPSKVLTSPLKADNVEIKNDIEQDEADSTKRRLSFFDKDDKDETDGLLEQDDSSLEWHGSNSMQSQGVQINPGQKMSHHRPTTLSHLVIPSVTAEIDNSDNESSRFEDSTTSFERHELEYEIGLHSPAHGSSFSYYGSKSPGVNRELSASDEEERFEIDYGLKEPIESERTLSTEILIKYMPSIAELASEEDTNSLNQHKPDQQDKVDGQAITRPLSTENLRLHDEEIEKGKTKEEILNEFVNIVFVNDEVDVKKNNYENIITIEKEQETNEEEENPERKNLKEKQKNESRITNHEVGKNDIIKQEKRSAQKDSVTNEKHPNRQGGDTEDTVKETGCDVNNSANGHVSEKEMNRKSHDTFSLEFHVPIDSEPLLASKIDKPTNKNQQDNANKISENEDVKKCLWYNYNQEEILNGSEDDSPRIPRKIGRQSTINGGESVRSRKKLTRDSSLAWDGLVDAYQDENGDDEEKIDVIVDFDDTETLLETLPESDEQTKRKQVTKDMTREVTNEKTESDPEELEDDEELDTYCLQSKLSKSSELSNSYLRLTPDGILSDEEDSDEEVDLKTLIKDLDRRYEVISASKIIENISNDKSMKPKKSQSEYCITKTKVVQCNKIIVAPKQYRASNVPVIYHDQKQAIEERVSKIRLQNYSYDGSFKILDRTTYQKSNKKEDDDDDESALATITQRIYKREKLPRKSIEKNSPGKSIGTKSESVFSLTSRTSKSPLKPQRTEDFTIINIENNAQSVKDSQENVIPSQKKGRKFQRYQSEQFTEISDGEIKRISKGTNLLKSQKTESFEVINTTTKKTEDSQRKSMTSKEEVIKRNEELDQQLTFDLSSSSVASPNIKEMKIQKNDILNSTSFSSKNATKDKNKIDQINTIETRNHDVTNASHISRMQVLNDTGDKNINRRHGEQELKDDQRNALVETNDLKHIITIERKSHIIKEKNIKESDSTFEIIVNRDQKEIKTLDACVPSKDNHIDATQPENVVYNRQHTNDSKECDPLEKVGEEKIIDAVKIQHDENDKKHTNDATENGSPETEPEPKNKVIEEIKDNLADAEKHTNDATESELSETKPELKNNVIDEIKDNVVDAEKHTNDATENGLPETEPELKNKVIDEIKDNVADDEKHTNDATENGSPETEPELKNNLIEKIKDNLADAEKHTNDATESELSETKPELKNNVIDEIKDNVADDEKHTNDATENGSPETEPELKNNVIEEIKDNLADAEKHTNDATENGSAETEPELKNNVIEEIKNNLADDERHTNDAKECDTLEIKAKENNDDSTTITRDVRRTVEDEILTNLINNQINANNNELKVTNHEDAASTNVNEKLEENKKERDKKADQEDVVMAKVINIIANVENDMSRKLVQNKDVKETTIKQMKSDISTKDEAEDKTSVYSVDCINTSADQTKSDIEKKEHDKKTRHAKNVIIIVDDDDDNNGDVTKANANITNSKDIYNSIKTVDEIYENKRTASGTGLPSKDYGVLAESLAELIQTADCNDWQSKIPSILQNPETVAHLYLQLAEKHYNKLNNRYDQQQVVTGSLIYKRIVENNSCNFTSVITYLLAYMGLIKSEKEERTNFSIGQLLQYCEALIVECGMSSKHIEMFTWFLIRPSSSLRAHHRERLQFLQTSFEEEVRQLRTQNCKTLQYLVFCFIKISNYFVQIDDDLTDNNSNTHLLPYAYEDIEMGFITNLLKHLNVLETQDRPLRTSLDITSALILLNRTFRKIIRTRDSMVFLLKQLQSKSHEDIFRYCKTEYKLLVKTIETHLREFPTAHVINS